MVKRDIHVSDVTPFDPQPMRNQVDPDHRYIEHLLNRSQIPPLDGAVPEPTDYYSLGVPQHPSRPSRARPHWVAFTVFLLVLICIAAGVNVIQGLVQLYQSLQ